MTIHQKGIKKYSPSNGVVETHGKTRKKWYDWESNPLHPIAKPGNWRGPFSWPCPTLPSPVVCHTPICTPWLAMGTPLSQLRDVPLYMIIFIDVLNTIDLCHNPMLIWKTRKDFIDWILQEQKLTKRKKKIRSFPFINFFVIKRKKKISISFLNQKKTRKILWVTGDDVEEMVDLVAVNDGDFSATFAAFDGVENVPVIGGRSGDTI